jgi:Mg2+/Co2+ transporter CorC
MVKKALEASRVRLEDKVEMALRVPRAQMVPRAQLVPRAQKAQLEQMVAMVLQENRVKLVIRD